MKLRRSYLLLLCLLLLTACRGNRELIYIQDAPRDQEEDIINNFTSVIYPNDQLYIHVSSQNPAATIPFNEETNKSRDIRSSATPQIHGYHVSEEGNITFPVLGDIHVAGKTREELRMQLEKTLRNTNYISDPVVTVNLLNFHVTVIGEVKQPQLLHSEGDRLTIFEAIARCGDITLDGMRDQVVIVRTGNGTQTIDTVDLSKKELLDSPYYYLQQNDIVYVEPSPKKKRKAVRNDEWPPYVTTATAAIRLAYAIIRYYERINK